LPLFLLEFNINLHLNLEPPMSHSPLRHLLSLIAGDPESNTGIRFDLHLFGRDFLLLISGGEAHLGALAASDRAELIEHQFSGHQELKITAQAYKELAPLIRNEIMILCGIHYNNITPEQISEIQEHAEALIRQMTEELPALKVDFEFE